MPNNFNPAMSNTPQAAAAKAVQQRNQASVQGHAITNYGLGNVPGNAQTASKSTANASYTDPFTGTTYYYYVPVLKSQKGHSNNK